MEKRHTFGRPKNNTQTEQAEEHILRRMKIDHIREHEHIRFVGNKQGN